MDTEVLVHIKAPARVADDKRYKAIARGVLDFEAVSRADATGVYKPDDEPLLYISTQRAIQSVVGHLSEQQQKSPTSLKRIRTAHTTTARRLKDKRRVCAISKQLLTPIHASTSPNNPPYRSPLRDKTFRSLSNLPKIKTPSNNCSSTTTNNCSKTLVPNTEKRGTKRAWPSTPADGAQDIVITNSQPFPPTGLSLPSQFFQSEVISLPTARTQEQDVSALSAEFIDLQRRVARTHSSQTRIIDDSNISIEHECDMIFTASTVGHAHLAGYREFEARSCQSLDLTVDATQASTFAQDNRSTPEATSLTQPRPHSSAHAVEQASRDDMINSASTILMSPGPMLSRYQFTFSAIQELPVTINAPFSNYKHVWTPAHRLPILRATAEGLAIPKHFKPRTMNRRVAEHERGYWKIPLAVTTLESAQALRMKGKSENNRKATQSSPPLLKYNSLTEEEFLHVWKEIQNFITSGSAGWNISLIRREFSIVQGTDPFEDHAQFYLQIYCYGEAIPYIYAMLLVCTRMHILYKPLQWVSTLDEKPVVTMMGDMTQRGMLGLWTQYKNDLGQAFWGCR